MSRTVIDMANKSSEKLGKEAEHELIREVQNNIVDGEFNQDAEDAIELLIQSYIGLIIDQANSFKHDKVDIDDLVQAGILGFIKAIKRFDLSMDNKLSSYSYSWINRYIMFEYRTQRHTVSTARDFEQKVTKYRNNGSTDSHYVENVAEGSASFERDEIEPKTFNTVIDIEEQILMNTLHEAIDNLSDREYKVICHRYELDDHDFMTLKDLGHYFDQTKERMRQIQNNVLSKLKDFMSERGYTSTKEIYNVIG